MNKTVTENIKPKENQEGNKELTWIEEYPTILDIINEYYSTCK